MHPLIRLGLELPPLRDAGRARAASTWSVAEVALAVEGAGVATLWLSEAGRDGLDPGPMAGSLAVVTTTVGIGVLARPRHGRHPSVLARDTTTIDLLSDGRAVVGLIEDGSGPLDVERLGEATSLLHRLLSEEEVTASGSFYQVAELTTRPRPVRAGGPPVIAGITGAADGAIEPAEAAIVRAAADAYVTGGRPAEVAESRARLDGVASAGENPILLWRGQLPDGTAAAVELAGSVLDAGADGLIAVLGSAAAVGASFERRPVEDLLGVLAPLAARLTG